MKFSVVQKTNETVVPIEVIKKSDFSSWLTTQTEFVKNIVGVNNFKAKSHSVCLLHNEQGQLARVLAGANKAPCLWTLADLPLKLPEGVYQLENGQTAVDVAQVALGWALGAYQYTRYKKAKREPAQLLVNGIDFDVVSGQAQAIYFIRDIINAPAQDLMPAHLAEEASNVAKTFGATIDVISGDALLEQNYPAIHTVGRASDFEPCLIDMRWGNPSHKKLTLVGKGICFDSGGLDIKSASGMLDMKKDMGGSAHALGLAWMIMAAKLPICLRVLVASAENAVSGNAYHPGDVITTRKGITVEIGNTDAEGRLVLCDALAEACNDKPDLLIDFATLTGASRIALGTDIPALFSNDVELAFSLMRMSQEVNDLIWPMPLHREYKSLLKSSIADVNNAANTRWGGSITAALYLEKFVDKDIPWMHFDIMAANEKSKPGRPEGGEAQGLRALFKYLSEQW